MLTRVRGFSIIELLVVVVAMAILLAIGVPNLMRFLPSHRLSGGINQLIGDFRLARQRAIAEGNDFVVSCTDSSYYWIHDNDDSDRGLDYEVDAGEKVTGLTLPSRVSFVAATTFAFKSDGTVIDPSTGSPTTEWIGLKNQRGERDSLAVLTSGMVMK